MNAPLAAPGAPAPSPEGTEDIVAGAVLRRVRLLAAGWGVVAGGVLAGQGGWRRGLVLTLAAALSIVSLRSLEGVVRRLRVESSVESSVEPSVEPGAEVEPGVEAGGAGETGTPGTPGSLGVGYVLRLLLVAVLVTILALGGRDPLALLLGLSAVPLAFIGEALIQVLALRGADKRKP